MIQLFNFLLQYNALLDPRSNSSNMINATQGNSRHDYHVTEHGANPRTNDDDDDDNISNPPGLASIRLEIRSERGDALATIMQIIMTVMTMTMMQIMMTMMITRKTAVFGCVYPLTHEHVPWNNLLNVIFMFSQM